MVMGLLAYVPYAAVGYCVAAVANDVWPTLRSSISSASYRASRHGMDGEWPQSYSYCGPGYPARNRGLSRNPDYCFNTATGRIEGNGPMDGIRPPPGTWTIYTDEDGRETAKINISGDVINEFAVCHVPGGLSATPGGGNGGSGHGTDAQDGNGDLCGPRYQPARCRPQFAVAGPCGPDTFFRNHDPNRLRRKQARWG